MYESKSLDSIGWKTAIDVSRSHQRSEILSEQRLHVKTPHDICDQVLAFPNTSVDLYITPSSTAMK